MINIILNLLVAAAGALLGAYILYFGRRELWLTLGIVALAAAANLLAVLVAGLDSGRDLVDAGEWLLLGIAVATGAAGAVFGRTRPGPAGEVIGFLAGTAITLWIYDIAAHVLTSVAGLPPDFARWIVWTLLLIGGLLGVWLVRQDRDEALILITVIVGAELIHDALGLSDARSTTAIIVLGLALSGVLAQYAGYLREIKAGESLSLEEPQATAFAYFQNLDLS